MTASPASFVLLGWRTLWRDVRAGELRLLMLAVTLAVAALSSVGFFADRLQAGLARDARQLLGGDAVVASDNPTPAAFVAQAQALGLQSASTLSFPTMARAASQQGGAARLVALKSVEPGYPLRGRVKTRTAPDGPTEATSDIPAPGQVWVDAALLEALNLRLGDTLHLGRAALQMTRLIALEPDRGTGFMSFAPRVMLRADDLPATGLVQPASRITYRFAVAGTEQAVQRFTTWAQQAAQAPGVRGVGIESLDSGRPEMRQTLERAQQFLQLVALLAALLAAVAVALAARGFANDHLDAAALLRVLGLSQRHIALSYTVEFFLVGLCASLLGLALGYALHHIFVLLLAGLVESSLPAPSLWPALWGLGVGMTLLCAFGLPPVLQLAQVPPLRVLRRDVGTPRAASLGVLTLGVLGFAALLLAVSRDPKLGAITVGGFAAAVVLFAALAWAALWVLRRSVNETTAPRWLILATRQMAARPGYTVVQVSSLAVGLLALVLLVLLRTDLIQSWQRATPVNAPDRFVINIQPEQAADFRAQLAQAGVTQYDWFPMFRGRLVAINDRPIGPQDYLDDRAKRLVDREFNLSHASEAPQHNRIIAGRWQSEEAGAVSVEEGIAQTLGLRLGDRLRFEIAGAQHEVSIRSVRRVDWSSMRANFFVMYPLAHLPEVPVTYLAAYRAPAQAGFDNALVRQFPNITNVDMGATLAQVQSVLTQVVGAVEFLFAFTLAAGLVVLMAAVTATRQERTREFALMRAIGAQGALLRQVQRAELVGVGLLAGFLASAVATGVGWALAHYVFEFAWTARPWVLLAGSVSGAALALMAGWWGLREVLRQPVVQTLRQAAQ